MSTDDISQLSTVLSLLESTFPVEDAYNRLGQDESHSPQLPSAPEVEGLASVLWKVHKANGGNAEEFVLAMASIEPFALTPTPTELLWKVTND
ncbi:hypothetical protein [Arthrobacter psychrolactophilus]